VVEGVVVGRSPRVEFKPSADISGDLGGAALTSGVFGHSVNAW
jgi:hypothetical protein